MKDQIQRQISAAKRNQILEAAAKVFAQKGFHPTTVKDVAREAGIADGTVYIYFENKTALLLGIFDRMRETVQSQEEMQELLQPGMSLRTFLKAYLSYPLMALKTNDFELFRVVMSEIMVNPELRELYRQKVLDPTFESVEKYFEEWARQQVIKPIDTKLALRVISSTIFGVIFQHILGDRTLEENWEQLPDFLVDLILEGISL